MTLGVRLFSVAASVVLGLGVAELGFRLFWVKQLRLGAGIEHPHFHHRLNPNEPYHFTSGEFDVTVRTNRFGLRGPDPVMPKPPGTFRILMLGDSYTFGFPVKDEETFCVLAEQGLHDRGYGVEIVNGGVSGYSPTLHYVSLRDQFLAFEPDLVLLWYDLGDLQEDAWFQKNLVYDQEGRILRCDPAFIHGRFDRWGWMKNHSALAKYIDLKVLRTMDKIRTLGMRGYVNVILRGERAKVAIARLKRAQQAADLAEHDRFLLVRESSTPELIESYWSVSATYLTMIHDLLAQRQIPFVMGMYPYGMLVGPDQWAEGWRFWGFERGKTYEATQAIGVLQRFCAAQRIPLINTLDSFRVAAKSEKLFYDEDGHFTPAGHRVVATHLLNDSQFLTLLRRRLAQSAH